jgi:hypothetical protein
MAKKCTPYHSVGGKVILIVIVQQAIILKKINGDQERAVKDFVRFAEI